MGRVEEGKFEAIYRGCGPFGDGWHYIGYENPEFSLIQKDIYSFSTLEEFDNNAKKLWPYFKADMPWTCLYPTVTFNMVHNRVKGLKSPFRSNPGKYVEHLWIEEED